MEYKPLVTMNPSDEDLTINSSVWLASRLMPGKGNEKVSFPHFKLINDAGMRTVDNDDLQDGLIGMDDDEQIIDLTDEAESLEFKGCWTINEQTIIGHCDNGLVAPFNTFNMGYRYKLGWRPHVS